MDAALYPQMAALEARHWWFVARRAICERMLDRLALPAGALILEPGCGTGGNFPMLARRGRLFAVDADETALRFAAARGLARVAQATLPQLPFGQLCFDLAVMTDVLEHLEDELGSLRAVHSRLRPGGWLLLTVPALPWLWSEHDVSHHHRRRYRAMALRGLLCAGGFAVDYLSYYNFFLFPAIAGLRIFRRLRSGASAALNGGHDLVMPSRAANALLRRLFASERYLLGTIPFPIGVSLIAVARA